MEAVLLRSEPHDEGSAPRAWPTTFFELSRANLFQVFQHAAFLTLHDLRSSAPFMMQDQG